MRNRIAGLVGACLVATALPIAFAPSAMADDSNILYTTACPEGYKGIIVGTTSGVEVFACTNLLP